MLRKQSLHIGVFDSKLIHQASPFCGDLMFYNGFIKNGYDAMQFDYRAEANVHTSLLEVARRFKLPPNYVWIGKAERLEVSTLKILREMFPYAIFIKWAADYRSSPPENDLRHNEYVDWFVGTSGGEYLKQFLHPNMQGVCNLFAFTDSSYYKPFEPTTEYKSDVLWTGRLSTGDNPLRNEVITSLAKQKDSQHLSAIKDRINIKMFGHDGKEWIQDNYVKYINGAKIGISVNSFSRRLYSSDRLSNYMACGTFVLSERIEGFEELLQDGKHLAYFSSVEEMNDKISFYLKDDLLRNKIAAEGRDIILKLYDAKPLVLHILDIVKTKQNDRLWEDFYLNEI